MGGHSKNSRNNSSSDGKARDTRSNFFQQCKPMEANAKASPRADDEDNVSADDDSEWIDSIVCH